MLYLLAILLPPLAILLIGRPFQALINFFLCFLFWIPAVIHAILLVHDKKAEKRTDRLIRSQRR